VQASLREQFELLEPVKIALGDDKNKSSKINVLSLTNAAGTELLLRSDELSVIQDWHAKITALVRVSFPSDVPVKDALFCGTFRIDAIYV
jgi:hypothetical protein